MKINKLLNTCFKNNHHVTKITDNSKECNEGCIFVVNAKNKLYLDEAINLGAKSFISEESLNLPDNLNNHVVDNVKLYQAKLLSKFYKKELEKYTIIGVTGTNGKTTTSTLVYQYLRYIQEDALLISSNGIFLDDLRFETFNTTPSIFTIYEFLVKNLKKNKFKNIKNNTHYLILECSSQGIRNLRVKYIPFDIVLFTNITTDHMDYHLNFSDYFYSKCLLLNNLKKDGLVITNKDQTNYKLISEITNTKCLTFGLSGNYTYQIIDSNLNNTIFEIDNKLYSSKLIGDYQIENIVGAYSVLNNLPVDRSKFKKFIHNLKPIEGRSNTYKIKNKNIIIDYAHTFPATKRIVDFIIDKIKTNLWIVVGSGGERDKTKRPLIGKYVTDKAYNVVFTEDNNRQESFESIIGDLIFDIKKTNYKIIQSRFSAIKYALDNSNDEDYILILGKGIEKTNVSGTYLTDLEIVQEILND